MNWHSITCNNCNGSVMVLWLSLSVLPPLGSKEEDAMGERRSDGLDTLDSILYKLDISKVI